MTAPAVHVRGSAELRAGDASITVVPAHGGKIISLVLAGREWLVPGPMLLDGDAPEASDPPDDTGYDECFPTVAACTLPAVAGRFASIALPSPYSGLALPERGELWSQRTTFMLETRDEGVYTACGWVGSRLPYRFARALQVHGDDQVELRYAVTNDGPDRLPFVWQSMPMMPFSRDTRLELPEGALVRVWSEQGLTLGGQGAEHRWPRAVAVGKAYDLSHPDSMGRSYSCKLFVDMPEGRAAVQDGNARLEVSFDASKVPQLALWMSRRPVSSLVKRRTEQQLGMGPCIGAPDSLTEAIGAWKSAAWLAPGETREWTVTWRGIRLTSQSGAGT